jgi:hypothetical protein
VKHFGVVDHREQACRIESNFIIFWHAKAHCEDGEHLLMMVFLK